VAGEADVSLQTLLDERAIRGLIHRFGLSLDAKDWDAYAGTFTDDGAFEILGQRRTGRAAIAAGPSRDLARYDRLQHLFANLTVTVEGDRATGQWYLVGVHIPAASDPARHADIGGCYRYTCQRTDEGWRFAAVRLEVWWTGGDDFRLADAAAGPA
jgi:uncharacterized protein (TIGR02246 family)